MQSFSCCHVLQTIQHSILMYNVCAWLHMFHCLLFIFIIIMYLCWAFLLRYNNSLSRYCTFHLWRQKSKHEDDVKHCLAQMDSKTQVDAIFICWLEMQWISLVWPKVLNIFMWYDYEGYKLLHMEEDWQGPAFEWECYNPPTKVCFESGNNRSQLSKSNPCLRHILWTHWARLATRENNLHSQLPNDQWLLLAHIKLWSGDVKYW